jgi:cephalosporin-C deacetylase-like acetyl esterase/pimeloyl-ACP methyl ester carboxylesterase
MRCCTAVLLLALAGPALAQSDLNVLPSGETTPRRMLHAYLLGQAQKQFDARRVTVAAIKTPEEVYKRQKELKARFIEALGGFPKKTALKARVVGKLQRDGYRIEKVVYESRPQHHVTATLYLPEGKAPFPGVLMPIGHSGTGKAAEYIQRGAILLAKNGLAVLAYDPIGQGERNQLLDSQGKPAIRGSTSEHTMVGVGALLVGRNTAAYRIWDGIRSLDYLASRPEVDPKRLGCTGCSGGGTLTSYLMSLDDRILVAAPSCYITSLERLFATIGPQDAEQNITGQVAFGMEHADYITMRAPRPTLVCCASRDFFDIRGTWTSFREAKLTYGLLGYGERASIFESNTGHGFPRSQREATVRWMRRWLLGKDDAPTEGDFPILKTQELWCTRTGQVLEEFKGRSAFDLNAERALDLARQRNKIDRKGNNSLKEVARLIGLKSPVPSATMKETGTIQRDGYRIRKLVFTTEPGIAVPGLLCSAGKETRGPLVIYLDGQGKAAAAAPGGRLEKLVKGGRTVLALDLRGMGETAPGKVPPGKSSTFGVDFKEAYIALHLNQPLLGQRVRDLLAVIGQVAADSSAGVHLIATGSAGPIALHAAALDKRIKEVTLERSLISWTAVVRTPISQDQLTNVVPGVLAVYDLPDLAAAVAPRVLTIREAVDPVGKPVAQRVLEEVYTPARAAYTRQGAEKRLVLMASPAQSE